jgi:hypothetical protein
MKMQESLKEIFITALEKIGRACWIKMRTEQQPFRIYYFIYYFGPFISYMGARKAHPEYFRDLENEQAQGITWNMEQCKSLELSLGEDA